MLIAAKKLFAESKVTPPSLMEGATGNATVSVSFCVISQADTSQRGNCRSVQNIIWCSERRGQSVYTFQSRYSGVRYQVPDTLAEAFPRLAAPRVVILGCPRALTHTTTQTIPMIHAQISSPACFTSARKVLTAIVVSNFSLLPTDSSPKSRFEAVIGSTNILLRLCVLSESHRTTRKVQDTRNTF
ncbi:hypothetical protein BJV78DRAFT_65552 [Lactifluus subvellereus]|nr:hypothetical protein BJV78DRAFT_65552 [Lactifluus subvellereus]